MFPMLSIQDFAKIIFDKTFVLRDTVYMQVFENYQQMALMFPMARPMGSLNELVSTTLSHRQVEQLI